MLAPHFSLYTFSVFFFFSLQNLGRRKETADLQEVSQAKVDIPGLLRDLVVADGDVRNDGKQQRVQGVLVGLGEPLGPGQLKPRAHPSSVLQDSSWGELSTGMSYLAFVFVAS